MKKRKDRWLYLAIKWCVKTVYPKIRVEGLENLPEDGAIIVGNHCKMNGPISSELYAPGKHYTWCAGEMMELKAVPEYAYEDFWSGKPKWCRPFYKLLSYLIAPLSVCVFNNAETIGVYHDARIISTFRQTVKALQEGANVVIFPEHNEPYDHIICRFQEKFIDVAKLCYKRTGKAVSFVPMYLAPALKTMYLGKPVVFRPEAPMEEERTRIAGELMAAVSSMAQSLPRHRVIPYKNVPKKQHPYNIAPDME